MERPNSTDSVEPQGLSVNEAPRVRASKRPSTSKLTEWQRFFLDRLDHLLSVQRDSPEIDQPTSTLLSKAVYSTYLDCQAQGVGDEALQRVAANPAAPSAN
jgi:hypothetical protein